MSEVQKYKFIKDLTHRQGEGSARKTWFNISCLVATVILIYLAFTLPYEHGMEDMWFVFLFLGYLLTVGGFDVILEFARLIAQIRAGQAPIPEKKEDEENPKGEEKCPSLIR